MKSQEELGIATTTLASLAVVLRVFTKLHIARGRLSLADYLNISALIAAWISTALLFPYDIQVDNLLNNGFRSREFDGYNAASGILFVVSLTLARLSILAFYLRLSPIRSFRYMVYSVVVFLCLYTGVCIVVSLLLFSPTYGQEIRNADNALDLVYGISNITTDLCILLLPIRVVLPLQMSCKRKIGVLMLFAVGTFVCATSVWRVTSLTYITKEMPTPQYMAKELMLSSAETNGAIICACVPVTTRFFTQFIPDVVTSYMRSSRSANVSSATTSLYYSTTVEKNKMRREKNKNHGHCSEHEPLRRDGTRDPYLAGTEMTDDHDANSFSTLDRNVLGRGRADTTICADCEVFAPDQAPGITRIQDTMVSFGP